MCIYIYIFSRVYICICSVCVCVYRAKYRCASATHSTVLCTFKFGW